MKDRPVITKTSFQIPTTLLEKMKVMCVLTRTSMGEFIRIAIRDKISQLNLKNSS